MFLNIITPCSRPENLHAISKSINIPKDCYRWIIVFDLDDFPPKELIPYNCEIYLHKNNFSCVGHSQRNFAIDLIENGCIYMNDDDTEIHSSLWDNIKNLTEDFISFGQNNKDNTLRLAGSSIEIGYIDSHNFIVSKRLIGEDRWVVDRYDADGEFAKRMYNKCTSNNTNFTYKYISLVLSIYNSLRVT